MSLGACILALGLATSARAGVDVVINFDVDTNGNPVPHGTIVNNLYAPWGVNFDRTVDGTCNGGSFVYTSSECLSSPAPMSPPNVVTLCDGATCSDISEAGHGAIIALFNSPADIVCIEFGAVAPGHIGFLRAYDENHVLIGSDTNTADYDALCVAAPGIHSVEFSGQGSNFGWFDNMRVSFETVGVEGSTWSGVKVRVR